jgi:hypothetical protein
MAGLSFIARAPATAVHVRSRDGCTETLMLAHDFTIPLIADWLPFKTFAIIDTPHRRRFAVEALYERSAA